MGSVHVPCSLTQLISDLWRAICSRFHEVMVPGQSLFLLLLNNRTLLNPMIISCSCIIWVVEKSTDGARDLNALNSSIGLRRKRHWFSGGRRRRRSRERGREREVKFEAGAVGGSMATRWLLFRYGSRGKRSFRVLESIPCFFPPLSNSWS